MRRFLNPWWPTLLVLMWGAPAQAAKPRDIYVEFPARKAELGRTVVLVDVVVVDDIAGKVEKIKLGRSFELASEAARGIEERLEERGVAVDTAIVAAIGGALPALQPFQSDSLSASGPRDSTWIIRAPFYADPAFGDRESVELWRRAVDASYGYSRKKNKPPGYVQEVLDLGTRLEYDTIVLLAGVSWGVPVAKQFLAMLADTQLDSRSTFWLLIADARSGEVLWKDLHVFNTAGGQELGKALDRFEKELP